MPPRISDADKKLRGTFQPCRSEKNGNPVNPARAAKTDDRSYAPRAPQELDAAARALWRKLCAESKYSASELPLLAVLCASYSTFLACCKSIREDGLIIEGKRSAASVIQHAERTTLLAASAKLGLLTGGEDATADDGTADELKRILTR